MQSDGNAIVRSQGGSALWRTKTDGNRGARMVVDDGGQIAIVHTENHRVWLDGIPRQYSVPSRRVLEYPLRGMFYYPWYPSTWTINGHYAHYEPTIGFYR